MAFNAASTTAFFQNGTQMALPPDMHNHLAAEGLTNVDDFADFQANQIEIAIMNLRTSIPAVQGVPTFLNPAGNVLVPAMPGVPAVPPCIVPA